MFHVQLISNPASYLDLPLLPVVIQFLVDESLSRESQLLQHTHEQSIIFIQQKTQKQTETGTIYRINISAKGLKRK